jgi:hypothetical protein
MKDSPSERGSGLEHVATREGQDGPEIKADGAPDFQPLFIKDMDSKEYVRLVNSCKSLIRSSPEYKAFIAHCKADLGLTNCSFLPGVSSEDAEVEIHHAVLGLQEIVEIVLDHLMAEGRGTTSMIVCHEVMSAHFRGEVCVVPLSETVHNLVHAGKVIVPVGMVHGNLLPLLKRFKNGIRPEHVSKIRAAYELSEQELTPRGVLSIKDTSKVSRGISVESGQLRLAYNEGRTK